MHHTFVTGCPCKSADPASPLARIGWDSIPRVARLGLWACAAWIYGTTGTYLNGKQLQQLFVFVLIHSQHVIDVCSSNLPTIGHPSPGMERERVSNQALGACWICSGPDA